MDLYRERLYPAPWLFIASALIIPITILILAPINLPVGVVLAVVFYVAIVISYLATTPTLRVTASEFTAGRARIPLEYVGEVTGYNDDEASLELGQRLDARAWLLIRGWIKPVVKVPVLDVDDPAPYWVISTRNPDRLVRVLNEARLAPLP
jgi:hypothetical protein